MYPLGKMYLRIPGIGRPGHGVATDRMEQHHAVVFEQAAHGLKILVITARADVLEHADRYDAIEGLADVAIVLKAEIETIGEFGLLGPLCGDGELRLGQEASFATVRQC